MSGIHNWDDVDANLKRLCELEVAIAKVEGDATIEMNEIKEVAKQKAAPLQNEKEFLTKQIESFCEQNKAEFVDKRSRELNFGTVGYRLVKTVSVPRDKGKLEALIRSIKAFGLADCIAYKEEPDKDKIVELEDSTLVKLGLKRITKDNFRIVPAIEKIQHTSGE